MRAVIQCIDGPTGRVEYQGHVEHMGLPGKAGERCCSFCGCPQSQCATLIENRDSSKHICPRCVRSCKDIL